MNLKILVIYKLAEKYLLEYYAKEVNDALEKIHNYLYHLSIIILNSVKERLLVLLSHLI